MRKSDEMKKIVDELKTKVEQLQQEERYDDAVKAAAELKDAVRDYKTQVAIEEAEFCNFKSVATPTGASKVSDSIMKNRVFNKLVFGKTLTDEERAFINAVGTPGQAEHTPNKGGYLVPEEHIAMLREYRQDYTALKDYCNVQLVSSMTGKMPTLGAESGRLTSFEEINTIESDDITFGQLAYNIEDYGDIIPVSNTLLADADVNLMAIIGRRFARKAVNTENKAILDLLSTELTASAITGYKGLTKALNVDISPVYYADARIFTNQDGFEWMSELEDGQNRPLLVPDVAAPDTYRFRGKEIVVLSNTLLPTGTETVSSATKKVYPFYVGAMADFVAFFERSGVEIAVSDQAGFTKNTTLVRAIERFDVVEDDTDAMNAYKVLV